jgi:hypothetical protein
MKKYFLTTALMGTFIAPAFGADKIITSANTCTVDVLGVSDNNATANTIATWDAIEYTLNPGQYLSVTETSVDKTTCPAGSYCVGGTGFTVDNAATSIATCPTGYENSDAGAGADTQCYTACTVATANIAHATAVSGNDYYGTGVDTCGATACETGYHVDGGVTIVEQTPVIPVNYETAGNGNYANIDPDGSSNFNGISEDTLTANGTWVSEFDYGRVYGKASCQPRANDATIDYVYSNYMSVLGGVMTIDAFRTGLEPLAGPILTDYAVGVLSGLMDGTKTEKDMYEAMFVVFGTKKDANYQTTDTGEYCYCQMDGFSSITDSVLGEKSTVTSAPWVFLSDYGSAVDCASNCAGNCAYNLQLGHVSDRAFRAALFGALEAQISGTCAANTINIDWNPDNNGAHIKNMCTYDGSITVPADPVKPGYTFTGWKLVE